MHKSFNDLFCFAFCFGGFFFFHSRIRSLNINNMYFVCLINILGKILTNQFPCMLELDLT